MEAKSKIGLVPQNLALYPTLNARDNLLFFGRIYGLRGRRLKERIKTVLDIVALSDRAHAAVATFSHGMKRRLNIAAGLLHEPEVLVLDEPTLGVDPQSRKAILENLETLNRSGVTILYTTHYIEEAERLSHRVAIMDLGDVIALDQPLTLIRNAGKGIIRMELNGGIDDGLVRELEAWGSVRVIDGEKRTVHVETDRTGQALKDLLSTLEKREGLLKRLDVLEPILETVFIHLTGRDLRD
jgi:ABC-2 type transport system ATP-binding protein